MLELLGRLEARCQPLFGTAGNVLFLASSGTGAMESAVVNLTSPGDEVLVVVGGTFSARWADIAKAYGLTVLLSRWIGDGERPLPDRRVLTQWPNTQVVFHTWSESSTGVLNDMAEVGRLVRSQSPCWLRTRFRVWQCLR